MRILGDGQIYLNKGEVVPYRCPCGTYIQTLEEEFVCDSCGRLLFADELRETQSFNFMRVQ